jgi:hypothetical protein
MSTLHWAPYIQDIVFNFVAHLLHLIRSDSKHSSDSTSACTSHTHTSRPRALHPIIHGITPTTFEQDLAYRFGVSISTVSRICNTWIIFLDMQLRPLITWPSRSCINHHMPAQFKQLYPHTRCIIDCTEIFCESPSALDIQSVTYSHYKHHNTFRLLLVHLVL